jgi:hypothetical protein
MCATLPRPGPTAAALFAAALFAGCHAESPTSAITAPEPVVTIERVTHPQLKERLAALRGKIVVVDFWGEF